MKTAIPADAAAAMIPDEAVVLIGGFMGVGSPHRLIDALVRRGARGLTVVANDAAMPGRGIGKVLAAGGGGAIDCLAYRAEPRVPDQDDLG